jgi:hypothetical protein
LYSSPDIRQFKSRRMGWKGHVAHMGEQRNLYKVSVGKPEGNRNSEDQDVDGRTGLELFLRNLPGGGEVWKNRFTWLRIGIGLL